MVRIYFLSPNFRAFLVNQSLQYSPRTSIKASIDSFGSADGDDAQDNCEVLAYIVPGQAVATKKCPIAIRT